MFVFPTEESPMTATLAKASKGSFDGVKEGFFVAIPTTQFIYQNYNNNISSFYTFYQSQNLHIAQTSSVKSILSISFQSVGFNLSKFMANCLIFDAISIILL